MAPSGIEPTTFRLVTRCLMRYRVPPLFAWNGGVIKVFCPFDAFDFSKQVTNFIQISSCSLYLVLKPALEPIQPRIQRAMGAFLRRQKRPVPEAYDFPPSFVEVQNKWSRTPTTHAIMACIWTVVAFASRLSNMHIFMIYWERCVLDSDVLRSLHGAFIELYLGSTFCAAERRERSAFKIIQFGTNTSIGFEQ